MARIRAGVIGAVLAMLLVGASAASASTNVSPRIVGGLTTSNPGWIAYLDISFTSGDALCGGELISKSWVLTAAHCVTEDGTTTVVDPTAVLAWVGFDRLSDSDTTPGAAVDQVVVDPGYDPNTLSGDVALLHLATPSTHEPIALGGPFDPAVGSHPVTLGWGVVDSITQLLSDDLLRVAAPILNPNECAPYGESFDPATMICAGGQLGQDSCSGDSGGPLVLGLGTSQEALVGTVDYGSADCGDGQPSVYQRLGIGSVATFLDATAPSVHIAATPQRIATGMPAALTATSDKLSNPTYSWDLDGDGQFDDATGAAASLAAVYGASSIAIRAVGDDGEVVIRRVTISSRPGSVLVGAPPAQMQEGSTMRLPVSLPFGGRGTVMVKMTSAWGSGYGPGRADLTSNSHFIDAYVGNDLVWHEPWTLNVVLSTVRADSSLAIDSPASFSVKIIDTDKPKLSVPRVRRRGSKLTVSVVPPGTGKVTISASRGKQVILRKRVAVHGTKTRSVVLKFTAAQRRRLHGTAPTLKLRWASSVVPGVVAKRTARAPRLSA